MSGELTRREFIKLLTLGTAGLLLEGCRVSNTPPQPKAPTKAPAPSNAPNIETNTAKLLAEIHSDVRRLAQKYPEGSLVRTIYQGDLSTLCPIFDPVLNVGIADPRAAYARTDFGNIKLSSQPRFKYYLTRDGSTQNYQVMEKAKLAVYLSPQWQSSKSERVKGLALEKEAYTIASFRQFSLIALNTYQHQGKFELIDPNTTNEEIAYTVGKLMLSDPGMRKLYDYAGYLPVLPQVGKILEAGNEEELRELRFSNLERIYQQAREAGVPFERLPFNSTEFYKMAFFPNSPWVKIISDPKTPGPNF